MKYAQYLTRAIDLAVKAGGAVLEVYESDFTVDTKEDKSPLTLADMRSNEIIETGLNSFRIPFVSEEGKSTPYEVRKGWDTVWVVDPLDGTKEFVKRNGEFTVNIALIEKNRPVMGVVYAPIPRWLYFASTEIGAYKMEDVTPDGFSLGEKGISEDTLEALMQQASKLPLEHSRKQYTIVGSRSHSTPELDAFVENKKEEKGDVEFIAAGSSLKICLVAEGRADIYPRLGPTMEWDTAAGHAVAECAGARLYVHDSAHDLAYNKADLLNPWFVVER